MKWCNHLLNTYGVDKWCMTCDPDEFLKYPHIETRDLHEFTSWMDSMGQKALFTVMIDCYGKNGVKDTHLNEHGDVFQACPYFDKFNFTQRFNSQLGNVWIQGGVRMRHYFIDDPAQAPALNKVPLIKWKKGYEYLSSMHHTNIPQINCTVNTNNRFVSGCILHFKYISKLQDKVEEEMDRRQHYNGGKEYDTYLQKGFEILYDPYWSITYMNSEQLVNQKIMHVGEWF